MLHLPCRTGARPTPSPLGPSLAGLPRPIDIALDLFVPDGATSSRRRPAASSSSLRRPRPPPQPRLLRASPTFPCNGGEPSSVLLFHSASMRPPHPRLTPPWPRAGRARVAPATPDASAREPRPFSAHSRRHARPANRGCPCAIAAPPRSSPCGSGCAALASHLAVRLRPATVAVAPGGHGHGRPRPPR